MRVHLCEPGAEHKEDIAGLADAACAGGVTCVGVLPNTQPVVDDIAVMEFIQRRAQAVGNLRVHCFGAGTKGAQGEALSEIGLLTKAGAIGIGDGERQISDARVMATLLRYAEGFGAIVVQQPNEPRLSDGGAMNAGDVAARRGLAGIPPQAETLMLARDLILVEMTGARYHASLVSTAASIALIRAAKAKGLDVTCDTAPPYFALDETAVGDYRTFAKLLPPLRAAEDRQAVVAALADGTIDMIVSDHAAQDAESKRLPFAQALAGGVGLETLLPLTLELVRDGVMDLPHALALVTSAPAKRFGLNVGRLEVGAVADLILFDPDAPVSISTETLRSKSKNTPFDGRRSWGKVAITLVAGRQVARSAQAAAA